MFETTTTPARPRAIRRRLLAASGVTLAGLVLSSCGQPLLPTTVAGQVRAAAPAKPAMPAPTPKTAPSATPTPTPTKPPVPTKPFTFAAMTPGRNGPWGTAIMVTVRFTASIPKASRKAVQERMIVRTSKPVGTTSWTWLHDDTLAFRPKMFWAPGTVVTVRGSLVDLLLGKNADGVRMAGVGSFTRKFAIGRSQVTTIDGRNQMATVVRAAKVVKRAPVSMGKSGWRTRNGIKAIMDREMNHVYTSASIGEFNETYRLVGHYNLRVTWSGEFMHSAPWAEGRLGYYAGSHGCTNLSDSSAGWFYRNALYGDAVIYKNTGGSLMEVDNGVGGPWNVPWATWVKNSAAAAVPTWSPPPPPPPKPTKKLAS